MKTNIAIFGIGGVGGFYGGKLAKHYFNHPEIEINFIARGKHLDAIRKNGLKLCFPDSEIIAHPHHATDDPLKIGKIDILLFCVKTYSLDDAIELVKRVIDENTIIIPLMNGLDGYETLDNSFPNSKLFQGCCYLNSFVESPGVIKFRGGVDQLLLGYADEKKLSFVSTLFSDAGINIHSEKNITKAIWEKFIFGSALSTVGSLANQSFGEILADPNRKKLLSDLIDELLLIANAKGIAFENSFKNNLIEKAASYPYEAQTSMQLDFANRKSTELESFVGYVIRLAESLGIEVPEYRSVYEVLKNK